MAVIKLNEMAAPTSNYKNQAVGWVCLEVYKRLKDSDVKITRTNDAPGQALQKFSSNLNVPCEIHITPEDNKSVRVICHQDNFDKTLDLNSAVNYIVNL